VRVLIAPSLHNQWNNSVWLCVVGFLAVFPGYFGQYFAGQRSELMCTCWLSQFLMLSPYICKLLCSALCGFLPGEWLQKIVYFICKLFCSALCWFETLSAGVDCPIAAQPVE
jgi:hypothetical protein